MKAKLARALHKAGFEVDVEATGFVCKNKNGSKTVIRFVTGPISKDEILRTYSASGYYTLLVFSDDVFETLGQWLLLVEFLHAGRVYVWETVSDEVFAQRFNNQTGNPETFGPLSDALLGDLECGEVYVPGKGKVRIAKFGDGEWWNGWKPKTPEPETAAPFGFGSDEWFERVRRGAYAAGGFASHDAERAAHQERVRRASQDFSEAFRRMTEEQFKRNFGGAWRVEWPETGEGATNTAGHTPFGANPFANRGAPFSGQRTEPPPKYRQVMGLKRHYDVLGVEDYSDLETCRAAYKKLALKYHPDVSKAADATEKMQAINEAWQALKKALE